MMSKVFISTFGRGKKRNIQIGMQGTRGCGQWPPPSKSSMHSCSGYLPTQSRQENPGHITQAHSSWHNTPRKPPSFSLSQPAARRSGRAAQQTIAGLATLHTQCVEQRPKVACTYPRLNEQPVGARVLPPSISLAMQHKQCGGWGCKAACNSTHQCGPRSYSVGVFASPWRHCIYPSVERFKFFSQQK